MEHGSFQVIYLDARAGRELEVRRDALHTPSSPWEEPVQPQHPSKSIALPPDLRQNIDSILSVFPSVTLCHTGPSCVSKITALDNAAAEAQPTICFVDIPDLDERSTATWQETEFRSVSPKSQRASGSQPLAFETKDVYGLQFLQYLSSDERQEQVFRYLVPIVVLREDGEAPKSKDSTVPNHVQNFLLSNSTMQYINAGAVDVLSNNFSADRILSVRACAHQKFRIAGSIIAASQKQQRSKSWVGMDDSKPYAFLREKMVSGLMARICDPDHAEEEIDVSQLKIDPQRKESIRNEFATWSFSAHDFTDDELLYGVLQMLEHTLKMPELEKWRLSTDQLTLFLVASRRVYNSFVLYHNFRHACDVFQAMFYFLMQIGSIPLMDDAGDSMREQTPLASLLQPFHALTLLISTIGHDVGHPGVNNGFLVTLNAPLAQLYNDRSVLESFHCAAFSQILRRYWPVAFADIAMRKLMINSILATDMGLHVQYMKQMGNLQEKIVHDENVVDGWNDKLLEEYKELLCCLLIKCADICNVARKYPVATKWAYILTNEFSNQGKMEQELHMPTCLFGGPPDRDDKIKMGSSQVGFMNIFASPLFGGVAQLLPALQFMVNEIDVNKGIWQDEIALEKRKRNNWQNIEPKESPRTSQLDLGHTKEVRRGSRADMSPPMPSPLHTLTKHELVSAHSLDESNERSPPKESGSIHQNNHEPSNTIPNRVHQSRDSSSQRSSGGSFLVSTPMGHQSSSFASDSQLNQVDGQCFEATPPLSSVDVKRDHAAGSNAFTASAKALQMDYAESPVPDQYDHSMPNTLLKANTYSSPSQTQRVTTSTRIGTRRSFELDTQRKNGLAVEEFPAVSVQPSNRKGRRSRSLASLKFWRRKSRQADANENR